MRAFPSPDGRSILLYADLLTQPDLMATFPSLFSTGAWVSFSLDPRQPDYDLRLRPFGPEDQDTLEQYRQCDRIAAEEYGRELEAQSPDSRQDGPRRAQEAPKSAISPPGGFGSSSPSSRAYGPPCEPSGPS